MARLNFLENQIDMSDEDKAGISRSAPTGVLVSDQERKSPRDWALETGHGPKKISKNTWSGDATRGMSRQMGSMAYEVAAVLHGWREHEHHENQPMLLTKEEFLGAINEAMPQNTKDAKGNVVLAGDPVPHEPALSRHRGGTLRVTFKDTLLAVAAAIEEPADDEPETDDADSETSL